MAKTPDLDSAYGLKTPDDNRKLYADWAETYDREFAAKMGYRLPDLVASAYAQLGGAGPVLDLGAGTGLGGVALVKAGVGPIDGTDISPEMLQQADQTGAYAKTYLGDLTQRLPCEDSSYAGCVSAGTFTHGHVGPDALHEVLRVLQPGGLAVLSVNSQHWEARSFAAVLGTLAITDMQAPQMPIYAANTTAHGADLAHILSFRKA